jgi:hypothetical protein
MVLGSTQPLTEMSTRNISWGKGGRCVGLTTLPPSCAECLKFLETSGPVQTYNGIALPFTFIGVRGGVVVKALRYKPAGRGFDSQWCHWNFSVT